MYRMTGNNPSFPNLLRIGVIASKKEKRTPLKTGEENILFKLLTVFHDLFSAKKEIVKRVVYISPELVNKALGDERPRDIDQAVKSVRAVLTVLQRYSGKDKPIGFEEAKRKCIVRLVSLEKQAETLKQPEITALIDRQKKRIPNFSDMVLELETKKRMVTDLQEKPQAPKTAEASPATSKTQERSASEPKKQAAVTSPLPTTKQQATPKPKPKVSATRSSAQASVEKPKKPIATTAAKVKQSRPVQTLKQMAPSGRVFSDRFIGLENPSHFCYLNSTLQALFGREDIRRILSEENSPLESLVEKTINQIFARLHGEGFDQVLLPEQKLEGIDREAIRRMLNERNSLEQLTEYLRNYFPEDDDVGKVWSFCEDLLPGIIDEFREKEKALQEIFTTLKEFYTRYTSGNGRFDQRLATRLFDRLLLQRTAEGRGVNTINRQQDAGELSQKILNALGIDLQIKSIYSLRGIFQAREVRKLFADINQLSLDEVTSIFAPQDQNPTIAGLVKNYLRSMEESDYQNIMSRANTLETFLARLQSHFQDTYKSEERAPEIFRENLEAFTKNRENARKHANFGELQGQFQHSCNEESVFRLSMEEMKPTLERLQKLFEDLGIGYQPNVLSQVLSTRPVIEIDMPSSPMSFKELLEKYESEGTQIKHAPAFYGTPPETIPFWLRRFRQTTAGVFDAGDKITTPITGLFTDGRPSLVYMDVVEKTESGEEQLKKVAYCLDSVIHHSTSGTRIESGHYYTYKIEADGAVWELNDNRVKEVRLNDKRYGNVTVEDEIAQGYMFFFRRVDAPDSGVPLGAPEPGPRSLQGPKTSQRSTPLEATADSDKWIDEHLQRTEKTPLDLAFEMIENGNIVRLKRLLQRDLVTVNDEDDVDRETIAKRLAASGNVGMLTWLVGNNYLNVQEEGGSLALEAATYGKVEVLTWLVENKVDLSRQAQVNLLTQQAAESGQVEVLKFLKDNKIEIRYSQYKVIAKKAIEWGHTGVLEYLIGENKLNLAVDGREFLRQAKDERLGNPDAAKWLEARMRSK